MKVIKIAVRESILYALTDGGRVLQREFAADGIDFWLDLNPPAGVVDIAAGHGQFFALDQGGIIYERRRGPDHMEWVEVQGIPPVEEVLHGAPAGEGGAPVGDDDGNGEEFEE